MMPQGPSAFQVARLPLAKFSHTTTSTNHSGPLSWIHVNGRGGLVCILDKFHGSTSQPPRLILRVTNNRGILEQLDLEHFVRTTAAQSRAASGTSLAKPSFAVVVKSPCLAVKYAQNETSVRRFQIKFLQDRDYYTALAILSEINCPLTDGTTPPVHPLQRPSSSSSWTSAPSVQFSTTTATNANNAMTPDSNAAVPFYPMAGPRSEIATASRPASSSSSIIHPLVSGAGQASSVHRNVVPALESTHLRNSMAGSISRSESMASRRTDTRPATVAAYHDEQQLNQMLPPKRELPFLKSSQGKPRASSSIQRGVEPRQLQASLTGNPSGDQAAYPMTERNASEGQELFIPDSQQSQPLTQTQPPAPESQPSPMSSQVQPLPYPGVRLEPKQPLAGAVEPDISAEQPCNSSNFDTQNEQAAQPMPRAVSTSVGEQLALYVSRPTPERTAFLENWMCELIEDDNFMTLCQDVEGTWRRFAFGMKG